MSAPKNTTPAPAANSNTESSFSKNAKIAGGLLLAVGLGYLLYNLLKRRPTSVTGAAADFGQVIKSAPQEIKSVFSGKYPECGFPLRKGCGGEDVRKVQAFLNKEGNYGLVEDGKFGDLTENAVIDNQMPFASFKLMHKEAIKGQVSQEFFDMFIKNEY